MFTEVGIPSEAEKQKKQHRRIQDLNATRSVNIVLIKNRFNSKPQQQKQWLKSNEVRKLLNISSGTLQNLRVNGTLTYTKIGGILYYSSNDLEKVIETNKVEATPNLFNRK